MVLCVSRHSKNREPDVHGLKLDHITLLNHRVHAVGQAGRRPIYGDVQAGQWGQGEQVSNAAHMVGMVVGDENAAEQETLAFEVPHHGGCLTRIDHQEMVTVL